MRAWAAIYLQMYASQIRNLKELQVFNTTCNVQQLSRSFCVDFISCLPDENVNLSIRLYSVRGVTEPINKIGCQRNNSIQI